MPLGGPCLARMIHCPPIVHNRHKPGEFTRLDEVRIRLSGVFNDAPTDVTLRREESECSDWPTVRKKARWLVAYGRRLRITRQHPQTTLANRTVEDGSGTTL